MIWQHLSRHAVEFMRLDVNCRQKMRTQHALNAVEKLDATSFSLYFIPAWDSPAGLEVPVHQAGSTITGPLRCSPEREKQLSCGRSKEQLSIQHEPRAKAKLTRRYWSNGNRKSGATRAKKSCVVGWHCTAECAGHPFSWFLQNCRPSFYHSHTKNWSETR